MLLWAQVLIQDFSFKSSNQAAVNKTCESENVLNKRKYTIIDPLDITHLPVFT
jgi:hypothetical protein